MGLIKSINLKRPPDLLAARGWFPGLIRKLLVATLPPNAKINVPAFEQVSRPGFDGTVTSTVETRYVPNGLSVWEIGTNTDHLSKANGDYKKRTEDTKVSERRKTTYVCVTSQEWQNKDDWAAEKTKEKNWKRVLVLDCNDVEQWIHCHSYIDLWLADLLNLPTRGLIDLNRRWNELRAVGKHVLSTDVFLVGRKDQIESVTKFLDEEPSAVLLRCASVQDGIDFLTAIHASVDESNALKRMIVVNEQSIWQEISSDSSPTCFVVPSHIELSPEEVVRAIRSGHHVLIVGQRACSLSARTITLNRQNVYEIGSALTNCGYLESEARAIGFACAGSSAVLKRLIAKHPATLLPDWAKRENGSELALYALVGAWSRAKPPREEVAAYFGSGPADMSLLEDFVQRNRETIEAEIIRWSSCDDPLLMTFGNNVLVSSRELAWHLLASYLTLSARQRFIAFVALILGDQDASFDLPPEQRWAAVMYGKANECSTELREGIIQTLALMAALPIVDANGVIISFENDVHEIVNHILPDDATWQKWATLDRSLPMICEAAPDLILSKIENDLRKRTSSIAQCFSETGTGMMDRRYHCGLLWALETLAWSSDHFHRVALIVLKLCEIEDRLPNNIGNRPSATFKALFNPWEPGTSADSKTKLAVLRRLVKLEADSGWRCFSMLVCEIQSPVDETQMPRWRTWADGFDHKRFVDDRAEFIRGIAEIAFEGADSDAERWKEIVRPMLLTLSCEIADLTIEKLDTLANTNAQSDSRSELWLEVAEIVEWQEQKHHVKENLLNEVQLNRLRTIKDRLRPVDLTYLHAWIFGDPRIVSGYDMANNWEAYEKELFRLRRNAAREIHNQGGDAAVLKLAKRLHWTYSIGFPSGVEDLLSVDIIHNCLADEDPKTREFGTFYARGRFSEAGIEMLDSWNVVGLDAVRAANVLLALQSDPMVWRWMDVNLSPEATEIYWKRVPAHCFVETLEDLKYAIARFVSVGRPMAACKLMQLKHEKIKIDSHLIANCLEAGLRSDAEPLKQDVDPYSIQILIGLLQSAGLDVDRLAWIEWGYLQFLTAHYSRTAPSTLETEARRSPEFFRALVAASYARFDKESEGFESTEIRRTQARKLLHSLGDLPGESNQIVDEAALRKWVEELRLDVDVCDEWERVAFTFGNWLGRRCIDGESGRVLPIAAIFQVLEDLHCDATTDGFLDSIRNGRGVTSRNPFEGGEQERELQAYFEKLAESYSLEFPLASNCFRQIAQHYFHCALREDDEAAQTRLHRD
jgi:hypothetical protein